ncbi:predicted protein [Botrytis cinerea T4]|uniref:Uncharacterized protein n=1 Tax=Botryotinia fuckeliana (strain T4) TaxID=999810 RepID=G2YTZ1_BOTF4|nr:predicted protein [Botrytis cinerea T4]
MSNTASKENTERESSKLMTRLIHNRLYPRTIEESFAINTQSIWLAVRIKGIALGMP